MSRTVVIVGAGQAGSQVAASLRELNYDGRVVLIGDEPHAPYQRPPLSKAYLHGASEASRLALRAEEFYRDKRVELMKRRRVTAIDRQQRQVILDGDSAIEYSHLVLATGARNRALTVPGADLDGVFYLRTLDEASALRARLTSGKSAVVIGAGFIGLEFAASAVKLGISATVLDIAERPMARALSKTMAAVFVREHENMGVRLLFSSRVTRLVGEAGRVVGVEMGDGQPLAADLVMIGIGVIPNVELARNCGLDIENGIVVDQYLCTSDPLISAIGDVAAHVSPYAGGARVRLESVQNALDQGRCVAMNIAGRARSYDALPWFWSEQGRLKLQMAGLPAEGCEEVLRGDANGAACSVFMFQEGRLLCVESVNRAGDHMLARRLISRQVALSPSEAADERFDLKALIQRSTAAAAIS